MEQICRACLKPIMSLEEGKNIFHDSSVVKFFIKDIDNGLMESLKEISIPSAIELIIGLKVSMNDELPTFICKECYKKLEISVAFRSEFINSKNIVSKKILDKKDGKNIQSMEKSLSHNSLTNSVADGLSENNSMKSVRCEIESFVEVQNLSRNFLSTSKNELNNIEDSMSQQSENQNDDDDDGKINESSDSKYEPDEDNNNIDSDHSIENLSTDNLNVDEIRNHDIESEIDVCSGEEDDVLELDIHKRNSETVEINSSSESDIEVCDYEPVGKKPHYNHCTPPVRF